MKMTHNIPTTNEQVFKLKFYDNDLELSLENDEVNEFQLAEQLNFTENELKMMKLFWNPTFNGSLLYLSDEIISEYLTDSRPRDYIRLQLMPNFKEDIDFFEIDETNELVKLHREAIGIEKMDQKFGNRKKYYCVTGSTLKELLMTSRSKKGSEVRKYFIKMESLAILMKNFIIEKLKYKFSILERDFQSLNDNYTSLNDDYTSLNDDYTSLNDKYNKHLKRLKRTQYEIGNVVYIISHPMINNFQGTECYKFGKASQKKNTTLSAFVSRLSTYNTGAPVNYTVNYLIYIEENILIEKLLKKKFYSSLNPLNKEWLQDIKLEEIVEFIRTQCDLLNLKYEEKIYNKADRQNEMLIKDDIHIENEMEMDVEDDIEMDVEDDIEMDVEDEEMKMEEEDEEMKMEEEDENEDNENEIEDDEKETDEDELRKSIVVSKSNTFGELQALCRRYKLDVRGNNVELYNRIVFYKKTGEKTTYKTLDELREECKKYNLFYTGNKDVLERRLRYFSETGKNIRTPPKIEDEEEILGEVVEENILVNKEEKDEVLKSLEEKNLDEVIKLCQKYKIIQIGRIDILKERIKTYLETGNKESDRRKLIYQYDRYGNFLKMFETITQAQNELNICKNILANSIDQNQMVNSFIFRSKSVVFTSEQLLEIGKVNKKTRKNLTREDHIKIKKMYDEGQKTKEELMKMYMLSNTQMKRILKETKI